MYGLFYIQFKNQKECGHVVLLENNFILHTYTAYLKKIIASNYELYTLQSTQDFSIPF